MKQIASLKYALRVFAVQLLMVLAPAFLFAATDGHVDGGAVLKDFIYRCINFALMAGLLAYFVTKPIRKGLKNRKDEIAKTLAEAEAAKAAAEAKHREYSEKLAKATEEIENIAAAMRREGELERDKIIAAASDMAVKIGQEAEAKASSVIARAKVELREEASRLAVALAEELLKKEVSEADQKRLVDEYMQKVGDLH
ncbi:MAG: F0F1 ATP synthase subunit B [Deltaproteobacteria bacterium]|jgi:F-type H+-transporting ATPase subunit b|nr:F0F1 ATP synthase subunit B [Deltaproteobacteria bacterium]